MLTCLKHLYLCKHDSKFDCSFCLFTTLFTTKILITPKWYALKKMRSWGCLQKCDHIGQPQYVNFPLEWRHNGRDSVSNHQPRVCLLNRLFKRRSNKTSKLRVTGLCAGNSPVTGEFLSQMASNAEKNFIWWRHLAEFPAAVLWVILISSNHSP